MVNLLPYDGTVYYFGKIMDIPEAAAFYHRLLSGIMWKNDEAVLFGKHIVTKRKVAWYGEKEYLYVYSGTVKKALPWTSDLLELKRLTEKFTGASFNSCLLNLYHNGQEGMSWHSDDEKELRPGAPIASLSFGAERKFSFRHRKTGEKISISLEHGSLLTMAGVTQDHWMHCLNKSARITEPRINLTFRNMLPE